MIGTPGSTHWCALQVEVVTKGDEQRVCLRTEYPGKLVMHWGVEGGDGHGGGWRLPRGDGWPPGTVQYKDHALQTPLQCDLPQAVVHVWAAADWRAYTRRRC